MILGMLKELTLIRVRDIREWTRRWQKAFPKTSL